jgi:hypothetical protein
MVRVERTLLSAAFVVGADFDLDFGFGFDFDLEFDLDHPKDQNQHQDQGSGQECPLHTHNQIDCSQVTDNHGWPRS